MDRITLDRLAIEEKLRLAITLTTRNSSAMEALTNPRTTPAAERGRDRARDALAKGIADQLLMSGHEITRPRRDEYSEQILAHLRARAAQRGLLDDQ